MCSGVGGFGSGNLFLNAELFKQGCGYHGVREAFSRFCHRHSEVVVECNIGLEALLQQGMSESIYFVVIWFVGSGGLLEGLILVINSGRLTGDI